MSTPSNGRRLARLGIIAVVVALLLVFVIPYLWSVASWMRWRTLDLSNVTAPHSVRIHAPDRRRTVYEVQIRIRGQLDGAARLTIPGRTYDLSGSFDIFDEQTRPAKEVDIVYEPGSVKSGHIALDYRFQAFYW